MGGYYWIWLVEIKYYFVMVDFFAKFKGGMLEAASEAEKLKWVSLSDKGKNAIQQKLLEHSSKEIGRYWKKFNSCP